MLTAETAMEQITIGVFKVETTTKTTPTAGHDDGVQVAEIMQGVERKATDGNERRIQGMGDPMDGGTAGDKHEEWSKKTWRPCPWVDTK